MPKRKATSSSDVSKEEPEVKRGKANKAAKLKKSKSEVKATPGTKVDVKTVDKIQQVSSDLTKKTFKLN